VTTAADRQQSPVTQLRQIGAFVAIVWAVAGTFVAFELLSLKGMDFATAHPGLFGRILLSSATQASTACEVRAGETSAATAHGIRPADARTGSWMLGFRVGQDAQARMLSTVTPPALQASADGIARLADALNVPVPAPFAPRQLALANPEFVSFVEADAQTTAHRLAVSHSSQACQLYKLGALWGYAAVARMALPGERSIYAVEIQHYATDLDLPEPLWQPLVAPTPLALTAPQINAESMALTEAVTRYLSGQR
jgi:hypothetical protein